MDALVSGLVRTVLGNLSSAISKEIGFAWGLKKELGNLESVFNTIQLVLKDAESKQRKSEALHSWLLKLKSAAYDAEDILDEVATEALRRSFDFETGQSHKNFVTLLLSIRCEDFFSLRNPLVFNFRIAAEVKRIRGRLDAIAHERLQFHLVESGMLLDNRIGDAAGNRQTGSLVNESEIYGRNEERDMIIEKLVHDACNHHDLSVYAICGMGGIGKTTLAQLVYNDGRVEEHFDLRIWVCVSDDFSIQRLIRAIIESAEGGGCNVSELEPLQRLLQEKLRGKRYLLVLDDVWNENDGLWDGLKETLRCGSEGSVLVVTSRIVKVAIMMSAIDIHRVQCLSEEDSWLVFSQRAFATREREDRYMEEIGKKIVRKCRGLPLAVKALGSLMRYNSSESEWLAVQTSEIWQLKDDENGVLPALRLSYDYLPLQLRQCFVYCCIFPKDYEMGEDQLVQLWMANGFISSGDETDLYLTGSSIFKELIWRSFFQDVRKNYWGNLVCKMHDLMHDLAESVMKHETCILEYGKLNKIPRTPRHLAIEDIDQPISQVNKSLRSLIVRRVNPCYVEGFLSKQQYLRVLDSSFWGGQKFLNKICKLQHLRYLALDCYCLKRLPESLTRLQNLQTLKFTSTENLVELPKGMKMLKNLYVLDIEDCQQLVCTPPGLGELTCLQKLSVFIVGPDPAHQIDQLKGLNLGGDLCIRGLDYVRSFEDAKSANLMSKINLTSLSLSWAENSKQDSAEHFEEVLKGLQPNQNLEKIRIEWYQGSSFPDWMSTVFLRNLNDVTLSSCLKCEHLPPFGKLPSLKRLELRGMESIKRLGAEWYGDGDIPFPALTKLTIVDMPNLEEWAKPVSVESFPCLIDLGIQRCPKLIGLPYLSTVKQMSLTSIDKNMASLRSEMGLNSVTSLNLRELDVLPRGLLQKHKALKYLEISSSSIRTLSNELDNLSALQSLRLDSCPNLEGLPEGLTNLKSLESLYISSCDSLVSIPAKLLQGLSSLKALYIQNCKKLKYPLSGPLSITSTLQSLCINGCPELELLPESMQQLIDLRRLSICRCEKLCALPNWIGSFQSLSRMDIRGCKNLKSLPDSFQSLKALRTLEIEGCPLLEKRCKKPKGEDWPKISHIPDIRIYNTWP